MALGREWRTLPKEVTLSKRRLVTCTLAAERSARPRCHQRRTRGSLLHVGHDPRIPWRGPLSHVSRSRHCQLSCRLFYKKKVSFMFRMELPPPCGSCGDDAEGTDGDDQEELRRAGARHESCSSIRTIYVDTNT